MVFENIYRNTQDNYWFSKISIEILLKPAFCTKTIEILQKTIGFCQITIEIFQITIGFYQITIDIFQITIGFCQITIDIFQITIVFCQIGTVQKSV